jgi:hypothetical protein
MIFFIFLIFWSNEFILDQNPNSNQYLPKPFQKGICENDFHIIVCGYENPDFTKSRNFIYFKPFNGNWSVKKIPSEGDFFDEYPVIFCDNDNFLYIFYQKLTRYNPYSIYYQVSLYPANYENFKEKQRIYFGSEKISEIYLNSIIDKNGKINIVFSSDSCGNFDVYHGRRINPYYFDIKRISFYGDNLFPQIMEIKDTIYIFYLKILPSNSFITLNKFKENYKEIVLYSLGNDIENFFALPYFSSKIFLFYKNYEGLFGAIYEIISGKIINVSPILKEKNICEINASCDSIGKIHLFFTKGLGEEKDIFYTFSFGDLNFLPPEQITFSPFPSYSPNSFYSKKENKIYIFWVDEREKGQGSVFYSKIYYRYKSISEEIFLSKPNFLKSEKLIKFYKNGEIFDITGRKINFKDFKRGIIFIRENDKFLKIVGI